MRLIDATIQPQFLSDYILERKSTFIHVLEKGDNDFLFGLLMDYFDEQPAAYDVDKVVEQLKDISYERFGYAGMGGENVVNLDDAIEIVKAGGENDE